MRKNKVLIWVSPNFKKKLKREAVNKDIDVISYTDFLAKETIIKNDEKKKKPYAFKW